MNQADVLGVLQDGMATALKNAGCLKVYEG